MRFMRPDSANGRINGHTLGLVMGGVLACWHVMWASLVLIGWGQPVLDFIFWLHFIEPPYRVGAFVLSRAAGLLVVTATMGYVLGHVAAGLWNATKGERLPTKGTAMLLMVLAVLPPFAGAAAGSATDDLRPAVEDVLKVLSDARLAGPEAKAERRRLAKLFTLSPAIAPMPRRTPSDGQPS